MKLEGTKFPPFYVLYIFFSPVNGSGKRAVIKCLSDLRQVLVAGGVRRHRSRGPSGSITQRPTQASHENANKLTAAGRSHADKAVTSHT